MAKEATVDTPCAEYYEMAAKWGLIHDLLGGTQTMRDAGEKWLPIETEEKLQAYNNRVSRSFLYGALEDSIEKSASKPFSKPVTTQGDMPEALVPMEDNIDNMGRNLTQFAKDVMLDALVHGLTHIFIEFPKTIDEADADDIEERRSRLTLADEKELGIRPYMVHIKACNMIGWRSEKDEGGREQLTQIRFRETKIEPDGEWGDTVVEYIRVWNTDSWELWKKGEDDKEYAIEDAGLHTYGGIPLVTLYTDQKGFMTATPPFEKLAWKNLEHWQKSSDRSNYVHFAGIGVIFGAGFNDQEKKRKIVIGVNQSILVGSKDAKLSIVEHTGQAAGIMKDAIDEVVEQMVVLGLEPFLRKSGNITATGERIDDAKQNSNMQTWVRALEIVLRQAYIISATWLRLEVPDDWKVDIFNEFGLSASAAEDIKNLITMRTAREIDRETFLKEIKRRSILSDAVEVQDIMDALELEGPDLSDMPGPRKPGQPPEDDEEGDEGGDEFPVLPEAVGAEA